MRYYIPARGRGGIGRRVRFRSVWGQPHEGSSPFARTMNERGLGGSAGALFRAGRGAASVPPSPGTRRPFRIVYTPGEGRAKVLLANAQLDGLSRRTLAWRRCTRCETASYRSRRARRTVGPLLVVIVVEEVPVAVGLLVVEVALLDRKSVV